MDLPNIDTYLRPDDLKLITNWGENWAWLAGGTWLFSEPQPHLTGLVDLQDLGWSEIEIQADYLTIGATCPLIKLLEYPWLNEWTAVAGFKSAVAALAASFKVVNMATVGGNLCLALSVGTLAPVMVLLGASYEIWNLTGESRLVPAADFQIGYRQTILPPGEILRRVLIPLSNLKFSVNYQRLGMTATDPAIAIVVTSYYQQVLRCVIAASVAAPQLLEVNNLEALANINFIADARASAGYRREMTKVLIQRSLAELI